MAAVKTAVRKILLRHALLTKLSGHVPPLNEDLIAEFLSSFALLQVPLSFWAGWDFFGISLIGSQNRIREELIVTI